MHCCTEQGTGRRRLSACDVSLDNESPLVLPRCLYIVTWLLVVQQAILYRAHANAWSRTCCPRLLGKISPSAS